MNISRIVFADRILINGKIYSMKANDKNIDSCIAIKGNKIIAIGEIKDIKKFIGNKTEIINLYEKMVLPSFTDSHIHPPGTYLVKLYDVYLYECSTIDEYIKVIKQYIDENPDEEVIYGSGWNIIAFSGEEIKNGPKKERLDAISRDKPIALWDISHHSVWMNSKAFEVFDITKDISCHREQIGSPCENIIKNDSGLWGCIKEDSIGLIPKKEYSEAQYTHAFEAFQEELHSYGITNIASISYPNAPSFMNIDWYKDLLERNKLKLRIGYVEYLDLIDYKQNIKDTVNNKGKEVFNTPYFKIIGTKILLDGVVESNTAYLIEPYEEDGVNRVDYYGHLLWDEENLKEAIKLSNQNGLQICIHCIGDGAAKIVLNSIEDISKTYKDTFKFRNELIHLQIVKIQDIKRMKQLGIVAAIQPYWQSKVPMYWRDVDYKYLGQRAEYEYPMKSLIEEGVITAGSSDCPVTIHPNIMNAIQCGVTRNLVNAKEYGLEPIIDIDDDKCLLNKYERVSVMEMIKLFTLNGAFATFRENEIGTLEVNKYADLIVLDRNILEINPLEIENTKVVMTFFDGKLVYSKD